MKKRILIFNLGIIILMLLSVGVSYATNTDVLNNSDNTSLTPDPTSNFKGIDWVEYTKSNMTDAQQKLSTGLLDLVNRNNPGEEVTISGIQVDSSAQFTTENFISTNADTEIPDDLVYTYISLNPSSNIEDIKPYVWNITDRDDSNKIAVAWVDVGKLETLAGIESVRNIRTVVPPEVRIGSVTTEGDAIHRTSLVRTNYLYNGTGMKIGVISDGVDSWESARDSGDLPNITVLSNTFGGDEGTAMLEIIHDMAPGAELYFHDLGTNEIGFNAAIDELVDAGCDVVVDDVGWLLEPFFEDGIVASHIAGVIANNNIIYVSAAGNDAAKHYQGNYSNDGTDFHNKSFDLTIPLGGEVGAILQWDDKFGSSGNDYDLYLYNRDNGTILERSYFRQDGNDDPEEYFEYSNPNSSTLNATIKIKNYNNSASKTLELFIYRGNGTVISTTNLTGADSIYGHPAVPGVIAAGAIDASDPGNDDIEYYSSQGPVTISYPSQVLRPKPDIAGIDGVSITGVGGFYTPFYGTSAAAPHVAAIAAQIWSVAPNRTAPEIREILCSSATDLGDAGFDNVFGYGRADALNAYYAVTPPLFSGEFPLNGSYTNNTNTNVSINITDGGTGINFSTINMTINGSSVVFTNATIDNGYRIENLSSQPHPDGTINVSVTAENNYSVSNIYLWSFTIDTSTPTINITSPANGSSTTSESMTISGIANGTGSPASVTVNGIATSVEEVNGTFASTVSLSAGTNIIYANVTDSAGNTNTTSINITRTMPAERTTSSSSGSRALASGYTGEANENIQKKEMVRQFISKGKVSYEFREDENAISSIEFDFLKNSGTVQATIEVLKERSSFADIDVPGNVYQQMNIWVGSAGFVTPDNVENLLINFNVEKSWLKENNIEASTVNLYRYSDGSWNALPTSVTEEDSEFVYFESETPGFSPFAIGSEARVSESANIPAENNWISVNNESTEDIVTDEAENSNNSATIIIVLGGIAILFIVAYFVYNKRS